MNLRAVFHLVSYMTLVMGLSILACTAVSWYYNDSHQAQLSFVFAGGITMAVSALVAVLTRGDINLARRDGFGVVAFGWMAVTFFGSLPYLFSGVIPHFVPALFETMSGFTTTGSTVIPILETVPHGILFWRALTHWFGGMGVLVLCVAILPFLGVGGMKLYAAEMPGPFKDRLTPHIATTAKLLWGVYLLITVVEILLLKFVGHMNGFDSVCHSFSTVATGGFSTRTASVAYYNSAAVDIILTVFMFISGINFSLHHYALTGHPSRYFKDPECRFYFLFLLGCCLFMTFDTWTSGFASFGRCLRDSFFTGTSLMTTTGFCTADFDRWPNASRFLLMLMMFIGGCAGSTGGGLKVVRLMVVFKKIIRETQLFMRPSAAIQLKLGTKPVEQAVVMQISAFFIIYVLVFAFCSFLMTFYTPDLESATSAVIASLGNVGPGLHVVGATQNYSTIPHTGQAILIICMLLGRLELYTVLVVLLPRFWKR